jgi:Predicted soluble lytic transglycosylase fused to an ABC-type amino acid-binding protein
MKNYIKYLNILIISLVLVLVLMFFLDKMRRESPRDLSQITNEGILNIVTEYNTVNYRFINDSIAEQQYELCKYIARRSELEVNMLLKNDLEASLKGLEDKTYDVIARNIPVTKENRKRLAFTLPFVQNKQVLVQRTTKDNSKTINSQLDLAYKEVYIVQGSPAWLRLKNLSEEMAEPIHIMEVADCTSEQLIYRVVDGQIDYAVVDNAVAAANKEFFPTIDIDTDISFTQWQAWAVRKDSPVLLDSLNVWIAAFLEDRFQQPAK